MLYQLSNGRVIELSTEQFFDMSDQELDYLLAYNYGECLEDPWFGSVLTKNSFIEVVPDTISRPSVNKLIDLDIDKEDLESD